MSRTTTSGELAEALAVLPRESAARLTDSGQATPGAVDIVDIGPYTDEITFRVVDAYGCAHVGAIAAPGGYVRAKSMESASRQLERIRSEVRDVMVDASEGGYSLWVGMSECALAKSATRPGTTTCMLANCQKTNGICWRVDMSNQIEIICIDPRTDDIPSREVGSWQLLCRNQAKSTGRCITSNSFGGAQVALGRSIGMCIDYGAKPGK